MQQSLIFHEFVRTADILLKSLVVRQYINGYPLTCIRAWDHWPFLVFRQRRVSCIHFVFVIIILTVFHRKLKCSNLPPVHRVGYSSELLVPDRSTETVNSYGKMALNLPKSVLLKGFRVLPSTLGSQRPLTGCWNKPTATGEKLRLIFFLDTCQLINIIIIIITFVPFAATNPSDITSAQIHLTRTQEYPQVAPLPLPDNIDQYIQFSPHRTRDINCHQLALANSSYGARAIDMSGDPRMCSYDAHATVNLNCMMQSTVPEPFSGSHKFTHLNMPGGQWAANGKYLAQDLQANHYTNLRQEVRSRDWDKKGPFFTVKRSYHCLHLHAATNHTNPIGVAALHSTAQKEGEKEKEEEKEKEPPQDKKTKLKQAFKEYGSTVVVFHVGISLMSLGMFYALVSR